MAANIHDHLTDQLFKAILSLKDEEQCYKFFEDICTISELKAMAQRLEVARMLDEGCIYETIVEKPVPAPRRFHALNVVLFTALTVIILSCKL